MKKKIAVGLLSIIIFLGTAEIVCRLLNTPPYSSEQYFIFDICGELLGEYDPLLFWRLKDVKPDFAQADYKIICLSDSVSVMYGGNREYPKMLENLLNENFPEVKFKVFNAGVPGYTSYQGYVYLREELMAYHPHLVIVNFGPNDHSYAINGIPDKYQRYYDSILDKILGWSKFYQGYKRFILHVIGEKRKKVKSKIFRVPPYDFRQNLEAIIELCEENNCKLILLTSPYLDKNQEWVTIHRRYNDIIRNLAQENNIPCLDLADFFSTRPDLFIEPERDHVHINMKGYWIIARGLFEMIKRQIP